MDHEDHVRLLKKGIGHPGGVWADLGSGTGAFTLALANLIGPTGEIVSLDRDSKSLERQKLAMTARFPEVKTHYMVADFTKRLGLPVLSGAVMANALHFLQRKEETIELVRSYLRPDGVFLLVEYDVDTGNPWVPFPVSFRTWESLASRCGFSRTVLLETVPSRFLGQIYSAASSL